MISALNFKKGGKFYLLLRKRNVRLAEVPEAVQRDRGSKYILRKIPTYNWYSPVGLTATVRDSEDLPISPMLPNVSSGESSAFHFCKV